ncbi:putative LRR receptor-like serine/threonine-protein kinase At1g56140 [Bidens hawaiensis]|uniref:putative LRR receptor-like serine/threonine-protein kinase At1g56140 n=1 Tax=Bidens hawaiensis TaxID=980011 RepID=UPI00404A0191
MVFRLKFSAPIPPYFIFFLLCIIKFQKSNAQTTDPSEVTALRTIFQKWDVPNPRNLYNISGEPCSGPALSGYFDSDYNDTAIECSCSFDSNSTCHITKLKINKLSSPGVILEEFAALTYLTTLKIDKNALNGTLPRWFGKFSSMLYLSVDHNQLTGTLPRELANLKNLIMLAIGSNKFSGTLPPELGNLVTMELLYLDSCGLGGEIPSTFANLTNMREMWASDGPFSGKIPSFIGGWTKLQRLRLQGNNFEGPIPASFSNLTSLKSLRISDLQNVSSSLDFITTLRNLTDLVIRNALVSGPIPSDIIQLQKLNYMDLSFNNINGSLPRTLMNMSSLISLFLGNNSLSGSLLPEKRPNLLNIDLSYNQLSGSFPRWATLNWANLQLNLVANNLIFSSTNISTFPGLNCLQRGFPCYKNTTPPYSSLAIKCGGPATRSLDNILFESENGTSLGPASYYLYQDKWAVSNGGIVIDRPDPRFIVSTSMRVNNTRYPELFRTSRTSPGSLRYYGFGLVNGPYTITLFFAETVFDLNNNSWTGHGRRVFDIYIQGNRMQKDFDISKEAGGIGRALEKEFDIFVTQNYLEIHLFWAGKGTCCIPEQGDYGPIISAIRVSPGFKVKSNNSNKTGMIIGIVASVTSVSVLLLVFGFYMKRKRSKHGEEDEILGMGPKVKTYTYSELKTATADFSSANLLGEGGFGPVYKGILNDGSVVAVKQLSVESHNGRSQFITEISTISAVQHWNLVKLHGSCLEGSRRLLVYEYLENKSLDQALFGKTNAHLDWSTRFNICMGTAKGLAYLHEESRPRIVHRDVKASNILLDGELCPKISDFGLAKLYDDKRTHMSTRVAGTIGYLAPEYAMHGHLTSKADVYGFGVVCLEIVSGRPNYDDKLDPKQKYLLPWAWTLYERNRHLELIDPSLSSFNEQEATRMIGLAILCVQTSPALRPTMSRVITMLSGDIEIPVVKTKPSYLTDLDFDDITNDFDDEESMPSENTTMMTTSTTTNTTTTGVDFMSLPIMLSEVIRKGSFREGWHHHVYTFTARGTNARTLNHLNKKLPVFLSVIGCDGFPLQVSGTAVVNFAFEFHLLRYLHHQHHASPIKRTNYRSCRSDLPGALRRAGHVGKTGAMLIIPKGAHLPYGLTRPVPTKKEGIGKMED